MMQGLLGSKAFVTKYLIPIELKERKSIFIGAYITDMVLHWDNSTNSQAIPESVSKVIVKICPIKGVERYAH